MNDKKMCLNRYPFLEYPVWKGFFCIAWVLLLYLSRETILSILVIGFTRSTMISYGIMGLLGLCFLAVNRKSLRDIFTDTRMLAVAACTVVLLVPMAVKQDWQLMYVSILICIYFAVFLTYFISYQTLSRYYVWTMLFVAAGSLVANYLLKPLTEAGYWEMEVLSHNDFHFFYNFWFSTPHIWTEYLRNYGIFREPGVYQFFLILALVLNNFMLHWEKPWHKWMANLLLAVTVFSTFSTGGIVELALLCVIIFFDNGYHRNKKIRIAALIGLAAVIAAIAALMGLSEHFQYRVITMLEKLYTINHSSYFRYLSIFVDLEFFLKNPLFGEQIGIVLDAIQNNTTSTMLLYACGGFAVGTIHVLSWVALVWNREKHWLINLGLLVVVLMSFNTQNLMANLYLWLLPTMALVERGIPMLNHFIQKKKG